MKKGDFETKKGFTIVEVSLVLAVAGLIFLMVFIALPALRASQRDTERKEAVTLLIDAIKKYQSNNRGALPSGGTGTHDGPSNAVKTTWQGFYNNYINEEKFIDPNGTAYTLVPKQCYATTDLECAESLNMSKEVFPNNYEMWLISSATCNGQKAEKSSNPRKLAVLYMMERGGPYCANT